MFAGRFFEYSRKQLYAALRHANCNPTAHRLPNLQLRVRTARDTTCATALTCPPGQHVADATDPGDVPLKGPK